MTSTTPAVVIGAGPYGLSVAAHLRGAGIEPRVFGEVMSSWREHMPAGMYLKSAPDASNLSSPSGGFTLADYCMAHGIKRLGEFQPVPIDLFIRYGQWFAQQLVPGIDPGVVRQIDSTDAGFTLTLDNGEEVSTRAVVVATGISGVEHVPAELAALCPDGPSPKGPVSHSSQHADLSVFAGQDVAVLGAGQSALETAALLHESGARTTVLTREPARFGTAPKEPANRVMAALPRPRSPLGPTWRIYPFSHAPAAFRYLPADTRLNLVKTVLGPLGAWWLRDRVEGVVPILNQHPVREAALAGDKVHLTLSCADGKHRELEVDHLIAGTGYKVEPSKFAFLPPSLRAQLQVVGGFPHLSGSFESSVPGLYFVGLPAAETFGPVMRFVCGAQFAAGRAAAAIAGR